MQQTFAGNDPSPCLGIDVGSVSLNVAVLDGRGAILHGLYERTVGQPLVRLLEALRGLEPAVAEAAICGTGSGRPLLSDLLGLAVENEIVAHAWGAVRFHPEARTVIEIGGQDSKLILLGGRAEDGCPVILDEAMNEICAAGTGSFLDQQAARLGVAIEGEFGRLALRAERPAPVAGRCSVFAKTDMIHLQQKGYPTEDILAGLCYALARNTLANLARGRQLLRPVLFQGGVAANQGVVRAFEDLLGLGPGGLIVPEHFALMGAIGAALIARHRGTEPIRLADLIARLEEILARPRPRQSPLPRLEPRPGPPPSPLASAADGPCFLGIDVGSVSTNIVLLDRAGGVVRESYLYTEGDPVRAVRSGLAAVEGPLPEVAAAGVTGSGRHLIGDFVGADLVVNEITAQARAARAIDPEADTVFEIGGQDSKFIHLRDGAVADFEMNRVCAAGTGAFLAEQGTRLRVDVDGEFSRLAFAAAGPVDLGSRCTVFMESDLIHHQQQGGSRADLVAGLAYAVARNYLEKVVGHKPLGERILFQGGVASNPSVVAAFESLLGRPVTVPPHNRSTGAIGAALLARDARADGQATAFRGFDLSGRSYRTESFQCAGCANRCDVKKVLLDGEAAAFYGSICGRYDVRSAPLAGPDLFAERERLLLDGWLPEGPAQGAPTVGIPRTLLFHELFPEWAAFFQSLGYRVVLSDPTSRRLVNQGLGHIVAETCFPVKVTCGHVADLLAKGVDHIFLPAVVEVPSPDTSRKNYSCLYVQSIASIARSAFPGIALLSPVVTAAGRRSNWAKAMRRLGRGLGHGPGAVDRALAAARAAQLRFERRRDALGRRVLHELTDDQTAVVVLGHPYSLYDPVLSLHVARRLRERGALPIPLDLLPLGEAKVPSDVVWKWGRDLLAAAEIVRRDGRLHPLLVTSFGCGPDVVLLTTLEDCFRGQPYLALELDEHFADAGVITRCEALLHECRSARRPRPAAGLPILRARRRPVGRTIYLPNGSEHSLALRGTFRSLGVEAELLPPPDRHTEELGRRATLSRACVPFIFFTGDALRMPEMPGFQADRAAFFIPGNDESCKVSQFPRVIRRVLDREGLGEVQLFAPVTSMETADAPRLLGPAFERRFWRALVAIDLLGFKLLETRPCELRPGGAEAVFADRLARVEEAIGTRRFLSEVAAALDALDAVPADRSRPRPVVGLTGEHYVQNSPYVNNDLVRQIERLGGQVWTTPFFTDYLRIHGQHYPRMLRRRSDYGRAAVAFVRGVVQRRDYARLERLFEGRLANWSEPPVERLFELAAPYLDEATEVPATAQVAKIVDFIGKGAAGIVHVVPLACLMSTVPAAQFPRIAASHPGIPLLTLIYDGLQATNQATRLQAFMHQVNARAAAPQRPTQGRTH